MQGQRGFVLLELVVGALIVTLLAVWGANTLARRIQESSAQAIAVWMLSVKGAAQAYVEHYAVALTQTDPSAPMAAQGYADWAKPTLSELKANALLATGFPERVQVAGGAVIRIAREGDCPGSLCRLTVFVISERPLLDSGTGQVDEYVVAEWLMAAQGLGGKVTAEQPQWLVGPSFQYPNPPAAGMAKLLPGTVALVITSNQLDGSDFLRVGDHRNPDFQGELTVQGDVTASTNLQVGQSLILDSQASWLSFCTDDGAVTKDGDGGLLMCRDNMWLSTGRGGGAYSVDAIAGCTAVGMNPLTGDCSCPQRHNRVLISDSGPGGQGGHRVLG